MKTVVVDSSVVASWFLADEQEGKYNAIYKNIETYEICAPQLMYYELSNILIQAEKRRRLSLKDISTVLDIVWKFPFKIDCIAPLEMPKYFENVTNLAITHRLTSYDAAYLELSIRLGGVPLATYDLELSNICKKLGTESRDF